MFFLIFLSVILTITLGAYIKWSRTLLKVSWEEAISKKPAIQHFKVASPTTGDPKHKWLFNGPNCTKAQFILHRVVHGPTILYRLSKLFIFDLPLLGKNILVHRLRCGNWNWDPEIKDEHIFDLITNSSLLITSKVSVDNKQLVFEAPANIPLETLAGFKPAGLQIQLDIAQKKIINAQWNDQQIKGDNDLIACFIVQLILHWGHPQSHALSERSAREIANKQVKALEPSHRYVTALHSGLLYSSISPIHQTDHFFSTMAKRDTMLESIRIPIPHILDRNKTQFKYYYFLYKSRCALVKCLAKHKIDVNPEYLFNNMIIHSLDHYLSYKYLGKMKAWTMDGSKSIASYFRAKVTWAIWTPDYESWIESQRIGKLNPHKYPFYHDLYKELVVIDAEMADSILASTSF